MLSLLLNPTERNQSISLTALFVTFSGSGYWLVKF
jgi:hypothetical protein